MRLSMIWRIMEIKEGVIPPRRITPSELACVAGYLRLLHNSSDHKNAEYNNCGYNNDNNTVKGLNQGVISKVGWVWSSGWT